MCARMRLADAGCVCIAALDGLVWLLAESSVDAAARQADGAADGPTIEEDGASARADGTGTAEASMGDATGGVPPRGGHVAREAASKRSRRRRAGGGGGR